MVVTVTVTELEVLELELLSPEYDAVIMSVPTGSEDVIMDDLPPDSVTGEPRLVPLTRNWTVPVAVVGDTVPVKFTDWPEVIVVAFAVKVIVDEVCTWLTVTVTTPLVLGELFVSPKYFASMLCEPTDSEDVIMLDFPFDIVPVPSIVGGLVLVSLNCIVPVAVFGDTVPVKLTD